MGRVTANCHLQPVTGSFMNRASDLSNVRRLIPLTTAGGSQYL